MVKRRKRARKDRPRKRNRGKGSKSKEPSVGQRVIGALEEFLNKE